MGTELDSVLSCRRFWRVSAVEVRAIERFAISEALQRSKGSPTKAAALLGISRASIYNMIKEYDIQT